MVIKVNNSFILQFGRCSGAESITVTFPIAFTTCFSVVAEQYVNATGQTYTHSTKIRSKSATNFTVFFNCSAGCWIATGC